MSSGYYGPWDQDPDRAVNVDVDDSCGGEINILFVFAFVLYIPSECVSTSAPNCTCSLGAFFF